MSLNPRLTDWRGKTVWLVGASTGIGRATASLLHARNAHVIVSARNTEALRQFVDAHPGARSVPLDVGDSAAVRAAAASVLGSGTLHGLVYCAGHYHAMRAEALDLADMLRHLDINYSGALRLLDVVLPHLLGNRSDSNFVSLVGSVAGYSGLPNSLAYGPTKAALINLAQTLYLDLHAKNIGVSIINPGFVETPLTAQNRFNMPALISPQEAAQQILAGWARGEFEIHFPKRFTLAMKLLQLLPHRAFFHVVQQMTRP